MVATMKPSQANIIIPSTLPEGSLKFIKEMAEQLSTNLKLVSEPVVEPVIVIPVHADFIDQLGDVMTLLQTMNILFNIRIFDGSSLYGVWVWRHTMPAPLYLSPSDIANNELCLSLNRLPSDETTMQGVAKASIDLKSARSGDSAAKH